jgi:PAT family beta-lactamase induction signal transducer AmpG
MEKQKDKTNPWFWIPSLYFTEGLPYVAVVTMSVILYKNRGMSNADIAFYTSLLNLPWVIKPFWSPVIDLVKTKRWWIVGTQLIITVGLLGIAFSIPSPFYIQATLAFFWLIAFCSATHDIAADGFYMLGLDANQQSFFVGIRSTFYKAAIITGSGVLVYFAGKMENLTGNIPYAWSLTFFIMAGLLLLLFIYHRFILPYPSSDKSETTSTIKDIFTGFKLSFKTFFMKKHIGTAIFFLLTYRFSEAQLLKLIQPFLLDSREKGGLGISTEDVGIVYGIYGVIGLILGGVLGGIVASKGGLKKWLWPMLFSMLLTAAVFIYLAYTQTGNWYLINLCVVIEQFGYGFGFTAYVLFMLYFSEGKYKTAHYALCTGFMALGLMLPGMVAGKIQEFLGSYRAFFIYVMICSILPVISSILLKIDPPETEKESVE